MTSLHQALNICLVFQIVLMCILEELDVVLNLVQVKIQVL